MPKVKEAIPHPSLELDKDTGLYNFKKVKTEAPPVEHYITKLFKLNANERYCPLHGMQVVMSRNSLAFGRFISVEGLECGCTVLITRQTHGFRKPAKPNKKCKIGETHFPPNDLRALQFKHWRLEFIPTITSLA
jgi:hypothetical protein